VISGEGPDWAEQIKNRAERSHSVNSQALPPSAPPTTDPHKAANVPAVEHPIREMPRSARKPDHFQERILKGDFYMD